MGIFLCDGMSFAASCAWHYRTEDPATQRLHVEISDAKLLRARELGRGLVREVSEDLHISLDASGASDRGFGRMSQRADRDLSDTGVREALDWSSEPFGRSGTAVAEMDPAQGLIQADVALGRLVRRSVPTAYLVGTRTLSAGPFAAFEFSGPDTPHSLIRVYREPAEQLTTSHGQIPVEGVHLPVFATAELPGNTFAKVVPDTRSWIVLSGREVVEQQARLGNRLMRVYSEFHELWGTQGEAIGKKSTLLENIDQLRRHGSVDSLDKGMFEIYIAPDGSVYIDNFVPDSVLGKRPSAALMRLHRHSGNAWPEN